MSNKTRETTTGTDTRNEDTINDSFLITKGDALQRVSYRKRLVKTLTEMAGVQEDLFGVNPDLSTISDLRMFVLIAEKAGCRVYQLTRL